MKKCPHCNGDNSDKALSCFFCHKKLDVSNSNLNYGECDNASSALNHAAPDQAEPSGEQAIYYK